MKRGEQMRALKAKVNEQHGARTMELAGRCLPRIMPRIDTGSLAFNFILGGGIPIGHVVMFRGNESSGKTSSALRVAGIAQRLCANCYRPPADLTVVEEGNDPETGEVLYAARATCDCVRAGLYVPVQGREETADEFKARLKEYKQNSFEEFRVAYLDVEGRLVWAWAERLGVDMRRLMLVKPATFEEGMDIYASLMFSGSVDLFALDSIAAMAPSTEIEESSEKWQQGLAARLANKMVRGIYSGKHAVNSDCGRPVTHLWINQERDKIGISYGDASVLPAGKGQLFLPTIIAKMWTSKWEKSVVDEEVKKDFQIEMGNAVRMNLKIVKNGTGPAQGQGGYVMATTGAKCGQVMEEDYVIAMAERFGLYRKDDKKWILGDESYPTKNAALERLRDPAVFAALRKVLLDRMLAKLGE